MAWQAEILGGEFVYGTLVLRVAWTNLDQIWDDHRTPRILYKFVYVRNMWLRFYIRGPQRPNFAIFGAPSVKFGERWAQFPS